MKQSYKSIKVYSATMLTLEWVRAKLKQRGIFLNKAQTLNFAMNQMYKQLQKTNTDKNGDAKQ